MNTKALRQKILDLAIHGKLVPQDPDDEPASVLLDRIKAEKEQLIKEGKIKKSKKSKASAEEDNGKEVPFEVPSSWELVPLSSIFILNPKNDLPDDLDVGFIPMALVEDGFSGKHSYEVRKWSSVKKGFCHFQNGDLGVAKISPCFENLKSCLLSNLPNGVGAGTTELVILRSLGVNSLFYLYLFKSQWYINQGTKYFKGVVGQQRVNKSIFTDLEVPLPPLAEQQRIVSEIEKWFKAIETLETSQSDLESTIKQTKGKILDLAIHGKLVPQDPSDEPALTLLHRINPKATPVEDNEEYGELPKGWTMCKLKDLFDAVSAKRVLKSDWQEEGVPFYRAREIVQLHNKGYAKKDLFITKQLYEELKGKYGVPSAGDIMISAVGSIGFTYIVKDSDLFYYKDASVLCLKNIHHLDSNFFTIWLSTPFIQNQMYKNSKGTTVDTITLEKLKSYIIPLPPLPEQRRIVSKIEDIFSVLDKIAAATNA